MNTPARYERKDAEIRVVLITIGALTIFLGLGLVLAALADLRFTRTARDERPEAHPLAARRQIPPHPRLQAAPEEDLDALRRENDDLLGNYGWIDRDAGRVRIPLARARALVLREGLPTRSQP